MPVASMARPIAPPRASISRTICPLATPPMAGLQLIWAMVSRFVVSSAVLPPSAPPPRRLAAGMSAADHQDVEVVCRSHTVHDTGWERWDKAGQGRKDTKRLSQPRPRRHAYASRPNRPVPSSISVLGSGTADTDQDAVRNIPS